jgi:hypothetical protein
MGEGKNGRDEKDSTSGLEDRQRRQDSPWEEQSSWDSAYDQGGKGSEKKLGILSLVVSVLFLPLLVLFAVSVFGGQRDWPQLASLIFMAALWAALVTAGIRYLVKAKRAAGKKKSRR